jgi:hypothetical protein
MLVLVEQPEFKPASVKAQFDYIAKCGARETFSACLRFFFEFVQNHDSQYSVEAWSIQAKSTSIGSVNSSLRRSRYHFDASPGERDQGCGVGFWTLLPPEHDLLDPVVGHLTIMRIREPAFVRVDQFLTDRVASIRETALDHRESVLRDLAMRE